MRHSLAWVAAAALCALPTTIKADLLMHFDPNLPATMFEDGNSAGGTDPIDEPFEGDTIRWMDSTVNQFDIQQAGAGPTLAVGPSANSPYVLSFSGGAQNLLGFDSNSGNIVSPVTELDTDTLTIVLVGQAGIGGDGIGTFINFNYDVGGPDLVSLEYDYGSGHLVGRASGGSVSQSVTPGDWFVAELAWNSGAGVSLSVNSVLAGMSPSAAVPDIDFDRFRIGRKASNSGTLLGQIGDVYIYDGVGEDTTALVAQLIADYPTVAAPLMSIDRPTGAVTLSHEGASRTIVGYRLTSSIGALDPAAWTSIAESYDKPSGMSPGNGSIDPDDEWLELTSPNSRVDLSEFEPDGNGALMVNGQSIALGQAWIRNPAEDVKAELLMADGSVTEVAVVFTGNGDQPFDFGDLDFDGDFDIADFTGGFLPKYSTDATTLSAAERYNVGDFNADGTTNFFDFLIYNQAYLDANPGAAPLTLAVPEPTSLWVLASLGTVLCLVRRRELRSVTVAFAAAASCGLAGPAHADLAVHFDPNVISTMFQNGNTSGGTIPVTGLGDPVRWITDVRSPTPGAGGLDDFVDVQQAATGATLTESVGGSVLGFGGAGNLLGFETDVTPIDGVNGALDTNAITLVLVGQVNAGGTGVRSFIDLRSDNPTADAINGFGLRYNYDSGQLEGVVQGAAVAETPTPAGQLFVSTLTWNGAASSATLRVTSLVNQVRHTVLTNSAASDMPIDHDRFRIGRSANNAAASSLNGLIGDVYLYNDAIDHSAVHDQLALSYVPEPDLLNLVVNQSTGAVELKNDSGNPIAIDGYRITSASNSLNPADGAGWQSFDDAGFDAGKWTELSAQPSELAEGSFGDSTNFAAGSTVSLGGAYKTAAGGQDLSFIFHVAGSDPTEVLFGNVTYMGSGATGDFDGDADVDGADFLAWQRSAGGAGGRAQGDADGNNLINGADLAVWRQQFGSGSAQASARAVPEPGSALLCLTACLVGAFSARRGGIAGRGALSAMLLTALLCSTGQAAVTIDRDYQLGDDVAEDAAANLVVGSGPGNVSPGQTLDSKGPSGAYVDLLVSGDPVYVSVSDRPGAEPASLGASFGGDDALSGISMNAPAQMWDNASYFPSGYPLNYEGIFAHGIQFWAKPDAALQNVRQDLVMDTLEHGAAITAANTWGLQFDNALVDSEMPVAFGQWTHVMAIAGFEDPLEGGTANDGALLVNGVAIAARDGVYDPSEAQLSIGSNLAQDGNFYHGVLDDVQLFFWGDNTGENNGGLGPNGQNWGPLELAKDNPWISNELARRAALAGVPSIPSADVNLDGQVSGNGSGSIATDDVAAFIADWNYQQLVDGVQVGDWISRQKGDLNYDGRIDLIDAFMLRQGLKDAGGVFPAAIFNSLVVPEPASFLVVSLSWLALASFRRSASSGSSRV